jgi:hypothetical protein
MSQTDSALDGLYSAPLDEFTSRRNALAKELAAAGDKEAAAEIKGLPKPNLPAWVLNRLARSDPDGVANLLATAEELRGVQRGQSGDLRSLHSRVREQVGKLLGEAQAIAEAGGRQATPAVKNRLMQSLMAAAAQEEAGALLRAGRLWRELEPGGFNEFGGDLSSASAETSISPQQEEAEARAFALAQEAEAAEAEAEELAQEADHAERAATRARVRAEEAAATARSKRAKADAAAEAVRNGG